MFTDYFGDELTQFLSLHGGYNLTTGHWIFAESKYDIIHDAIKEFKHLMSYDVPDMENVRNCLQKRVSKNEIEDFLTTRPVPLYEHQLSAVPIISNSKSFLLGDDMGLGKTVTSLTIILHGIKYLGFKKVLVFCQKRAINQWVNYSKTFTPELSPVAVEGPPKKRQEIWLSDETVIVTNLEKILNDFDYINKHHWDLIILDEASYFIKNPNSKRAKKLYRLKTDKTIGLTGTPLENNLVDVYALFKFLKPDLFPLYSQFEKDYVKTVNQKVRVRKFVRGRPKIFDINVKKIVGYQNLDDFKSKIGPYYIRRIADEVGVQLPEIVEENFIIPLLPVQKKVYETVMKDVIKLNDKVSINKEGNRIKMMRACDHSKIIDESTNSSNKIESLLELIEQNSHRKIIVFSMWADMISLIHKTLADIPHAVVVGTGSRKKFPDIKIKDEEQFARFKDDVNILIATDAVSRSQDFPFASVTINIDLPLNPATLLQRNRRMHRLSSTHKTQFVFNLVSEDTIEEKILGILRRKMQLAIDVIDENEYQVDANISFNLYDLLRSG